MEKRTLLLVGAGGHARSCIDVIEQEGRFAVAGLVGVPVEVGTRVLGYTVLGSDTQLAELARQHGRALVTVGQIKTADLRIRLFALLERSGCELPVIVSPQAYVSPRATLGAGTIVMHGAVVNTGAVVGRNCILNSRSLVEHDAVVGDHCHISTAAVINGGVQVGGETFVGSGAHVREMVRIGERCVIGMQQRVLSDCAAGTRVPSSGRRS